jgi:hypothetical protein
MDSLTNNFVTFVTLNNVTRGMVIDVPEFDLADGSNDDIVDIVLSFPNITINAGDELRTCNMILNDISIVCKTGHNSSSIRPEYFDVLLHCNYKHERFIVL